MWQCTEFVCIFWIKSCVSIQPLTPLYCAGQPPYTPYKSPYFFPPYFPIHRQPHLVTTSIHFRIYVYIQLIVTKLGIFKSVTSHGHTITNINCKCTLNVYLACFSTNLLHPTCKIPLQKEAVAEVLIIRKGTRQEVPDCKQKLNGRNIQSFGQLFNESDPLSFAQTHEQLGIMCIPNVLWIRCNLYGQLVHDPKTTSEDITRIYPVKLHLASLRGKRTSIYEYFTAVQRTIFFVVFKHTT